MVSLICIGVCGVGVIDYSQIAFIDSCCNFFSCVIWTSICL